MPCDLVADCKTAHPSPYAVYWQPRGALFSITEPE
jgi:hypothetical protein